MLEKALNCAGKVNEPSIWGFGVFHLQLVK